MSMADQTVDLEPVVRAARRYPDSFLAGRVDPAKEEALAARLGLGRLRMQRLLLCRPPRAMAQVTEIAALVGVSSSALARALRDHRLLPGSRRD